MVRHGTLSIMPDRDPKLTADVELRNARYQSVIYEAIAVAMSDPHTVLEMVLMASDPAAATRALQERFDISEPQALAVLDMQFRRVTAADRAKIEQRRQELAERVRDLKEQLGGP
jgi:DNA gyrase subunit A